MPFEGHITLVVIKATATVTSVTDVDGAHHPAVGAAYGLADFAGSKGSLENQCHATLVGDQVGQVF